MAGRTMSAAAWSGDKNLDAQIRVTSSYGPFARAGLFDAEAPRSKNSQTVSSVKRNSTACYEMREPAVNSARQQVPLLLFDLHAVGEVENTRGGAQGLDF